MERKIATEADVRSYFDTCSNWGRWGPKDELGTLNHIAAKNRKQAASLVREGVSITCSRPIRSDDIRDDQRERPVLYMVATGERPSTMTHQEHHSAREFIGFVYHGTHMTHLDSLAHMFWNGKMYNGFDADNVNHIQGASKSPVDVAATGILTRGILLDVPRIKGVAYLDADEAIFPDQLEAAEKSCGVTVGLGDALLVRTGWVRRRKELGATRGSNPGLHASCIPWLHRRDIAVLASDAISDVQPSGYSVVTPIHDVGQPKMGLWLIDAMDMEDLAAACVRFNRWEFMLTVNPLRLVNGTGSPVNPIATF